MMQFGCDTWVMTSRNYWGCVEFTNFDQYLCHYNWKASVGPPKDYLDFDDVAKCGTCTTECTGGSYVRWGVDPYLDETKYYINTEHPMGLAAMRHFGKPFGLSLKWKYARRMVHAQIP